MNVHISISCITCNHLFSLVVFAMFHLCLSNQNLDDVLCMDTERQALVEFKQGLIDEAGWLSSWDGDQQSDCCRWAGIVCDNITGHVHQIHLRGADGHCVNNYDGNLKQLLKGNLSTSLMHLKQLRHLDLSCNDFGGIQVPKFIGSLRKLRYLNLSKSAFGGIMSPQLGNLSELQVLALGSFYLTAESTSMMNMQWLSSLPMLHHLDLSGVDLSKANDWFQVINTLPSLVQLHLSYCQISDAHPEVASLNLTSLSLLDLFGNSFHTLVPWWIFSISSLRSLDLSECSFHGRIHSHVSFRNLTSLESLHVSGNDYMNSTFVLKDLSSSVGSNLISLDMSLCGISSSVLDSLHNLTSLLSLDLSQNQLTKTIPKLLGNHCIFREVDFSGNRFGNISFAYLLGSFFECKSPSLESLFIGYSEVSGHLPIKLRQLKSLIHLHIYQNYVVGTIPDSIARLSLLKTLSLEENLISGPIPYSIGRLSLLEEMDLSGNQLNGSLPDSIGQLSSLNELDLSNNQLNGRLPDSIGLLSSMKQLLLGYNQLNGSLPDSIGQLSSLKFLDLQHNQLDGSLPDSIGQLSSLEALHLSYNQLDGTLPDSIGQLSLLENLDLSNNQVNGSLPNSLGQLPKLQFLEFSNNLLTGVLTEAHFAKLVSLVFLHGAGNNLTLRPRIENWTPPFHMKQLYLNSWVLGPHFPLWLQSQRDLIELDISNTSISSPMPHSFLRSFPNLVYLDMSQNYIQGTLSESPVTLRYIDLSSNKFRGKLHQFLCSSGVKKAQALNLGNNHLSGVIPECWEKWSSLLILNLENNNLSGEIPTSLGFLTGLQVMNMQDNKISGRLPASLMNLTNLKILQLGKNELFGSMPTWFGTNLSSLRILNLRSNKFGGNIPLDLCFLTHIQILYLANNNFSGNIPRCFNNFSVLSGKENVSEVEYIFPIRNVGSTISGDSLVMKGREDMYREFLGLVLLLDLSSNNFLGQIPSELTALHELQSLNLSRNQLTGVIPQKIGELKELESFDLSMNKLSGELPLSLSSLSFLSSFNVSYNNLTGRVPISTQLQSFNESSFFGNKLCGSPLTKSCEAVQAPHKQDQKEDEGSQGKDRGLIISIVLGFVAGFWIIVAPLIVSKSWRKKYFAFLNE